MSETKKFRIALMQVKTVNDRPVYSFLTPLATDNERSMINQTFGKVSVGDREKAKQSGIRFTLLSRSVM